MSFVHRTIPRVDRRRTRRVPRRIESVHAGRWGHRRVAAGSGSKREFRRLRALRLYQQAEYASLRPGERGRERRGLQPWRVFARL